MSRVNGMLVAMYRRWLFEVWGAGDFAVADELLAEDLIDHNAVPGQPSGRAGDLWAARSVRTAFPDLVFTLDLAFEHGDLVTRPAPILKLAARRSARRYRKQRPSDPTPRP